MHELFSFYDLAIYLFLFWVSLFLSPMTRESLIWGKKLKETKFDRFSKGEKRGKAEELFAWCSSTCGFFSLLGFSASLGSPTMMHSGCTFPTETRFCMDINGIISSTNKSDVKREQLTMPPFFSFFFLKRQILFGFLLWWGIKESSPFSRVVKAWKQKKKKKKPHPSPSTCRTIYKTFELCFTRVHPIIKHKLFWKKLLGFVYQASRFEPSIIQMYCVWL